MPGCTAWWPGLLAGLVTAVFLGGAVPGPRQEPALELRGRVLTAAGEPVAGASVRLLLPLHRQVPGVDERDQPTELLVAATESAADGSFRFRLEVWRPLDLVVEAEGFAFTKLPNLYAGEDVRVVLAPAAAVFGTVTDDRSGAPLEGVEIEAVPGVLRAPGAPRFHAVSGPDGAYRLSGLPPAYFRIEARQPGHVTAWNHSLTLAAGEERRLDLSLEGGTTIRGRVTDAGTHRPIPGATVNLRAADPAHAAHADTEGRYELAGVPVGYDDRVRFRAPGYGEYDYRVRLVPEEGLDLDIGLLPGRRATGRVLDRDGQPVAGAFVVAAARLYRQQYDDWQDDRVSTRSDGEGRFVLADLRVDLRHTLLVRAEGHATAVFDFPAAEWSTPELDLGDLVLEPPASIAGRVLDSHGEPIPEIWVLLDGEPRRRDDLGPSLEGPEGYMGGEGFGFGRILARTDARGRFALADLPAGEWWLSAGAKGYARRGDRRVVLEEEQQLDDVELVVDTGLSIQGVVVDEAGHLVPGATVDVRAEYPSHPLTYTLARQDGSFLLTGLDPGAYLVTASPGGRTQRLAERRLDAVPAGTKDLRIVLPAAAEIRGTVLGPDGEPVAGAAILLVEGEEFLRMLGSSDRHGRFSSWIEKGTTATLVVQPPAGAPGLTVTDVPAGTLDLVVRLPKLP